MGRRGTSDRRRGRGRAIVVAAALATCGAMTLPAAAGAFGLPAGPAPATATAAKAKAKKKKAKPVSVKVTVTNTTQKGVVTAKKLKVRVAATGKVAATVRVRVGKTTGITKTVKLSFKRKASRSVSLALTSKGLAKLKACGSPKLVVEVTYGKKKASKSRTLSKHGGYCTPPVVTPPGPKPPVTPPVDPPVDPGPDCDPASADPVDQTRCLLPFPSNYYTTPDASTATGLRLNLADAQMPHNVSRGTIGAAPYNRNDGFSPNSPIVTRVPGLESKAALDASGIAPQTDMGRSLDPDQSVMVLNAETGEQQLIWTEVDVSTADLSKRTLLIHGGKVFQEATRYIVVLRNLKDAAGQPLAATGWFKDFRDNSVPAGAPANVKARQASMEEIFTKLSGFGVARSSLYRAWDFTTASEQNLTERVLKMRDDAYAQLGDTDMDDMIPTGLAPQATVKDVKEYTTSESPYVLRRVRGTIKVPCFMGFKTVNGGTAANCAPGTEMTYGPDGLPTQATTPSGAPAFYDAPFTCMVPRAAINSPEMATNKRAIIYGHGLLGDASEVEANRDEPGMLTNVMCASDWIGLSESDITTVVTLLPDMNKFRTLADRSQQGLLNFMYLGRWMISQAAGGLNDTAAFQPTSGKVEDASQPLYYVGGSQGGIMGGALTAVEPDLNRSVLIVPAIGYATLLYRSVDFNKFLGTFRSGYPNPIDQQIILSLIQTLWDRGEGGGYALHMTSDHLRDTPAHKVVLIEGYGDHEVSNVQTETEARTINAVIRGEDQYNLDPGRSLDVVPFYGIPREPLASFTAPGGYQGDATFIPIDIGPVRGTPGNWAGSNPNPPYNQPPIEETDAAANDGKNPHTVASRSAASLGIVFDFLTPNGGVGDTCDGKPCYAGGWTGP